MKLHYTILLRLKHENLLELFLSFQASDSASLYSLETLMNEFFNGTTNNQRKREIGLLILYYTVKT
jgi:hypothetical protein